MRKYGNIGSIHEIYSPCPTPKVLLQKLFRKFCHVACLNYSTQPASFCRTFELLCTGTVVATHSYQKHGSNRRFPKWKWTQFRWLFFYHTRTLPSWSPYGEAKHHTLLCYTLTRMEAVGNTTKTLVKLSILQVCVSACACVMRCACVCLYVLAYVNVCVCVDVSHSISFF